MTPTPLISICIPTFNRAHHLKKLFANLMVLTASHKCDIEICVSNNNSTDETGEVIDAWRTMLNLKVLVQLKNIGGSLNIIAVTKIASGKWIQVIGDDDELVPQNFTNLIKMLKTSAPETWYLVGVGDAAGDEVLLGNLTEGYRKTKEIRKDVLRQGLFRFGFLGMHVIPSSWLPIYQKMSLQDMHGWPHLALFLRYICGGGVVMIFKQSVVKQKVGDGALWWTAGDWVRVNLKKIDIALAAREGGGASGSFYDFVVLRELYSMRNIKELIMWKILECSDFNRNMLSQYLSRYVALGLPAVLAIFHLVLLLGLWISPLQVLRFVMRQLGRGGIMSEYLIQKKALQKFDGIERGL